MTFDSFRGPCRVLCFIAALFAVSAEAYFPCADILLGHPPSRSGVQGEPVIQHPEQYETIDVRLIGTEEVPGFLRTAQAHAQAGRFDDAFRDLLGEAGAGGSFQSSEGTFSIRHPSRGNLQVVLSGAVIIDQTDLLHDHAAVIAQLRQAIWSGGTDASGRPVVSLPNIIVNRNDGSGTHHPLFRPERGVFNVDLPPEICRYLFERTMREVVRAYQRQTPTGFLAFSRLLRPQQERTPIVAGRTRWEESIEEIDYFLFLTEIRQGTVPASSLPPPIQSWLYRAHNRGRITGGFMQGHIDFGTQGWANTMAAWSQL